MTATSKRRLLLLAGVLFTAWAVWQVRDADVPASPAAFGRRAAVGASMPVAGDTGQFALALPVRPKYEDPVRDLFELPQVSQKVEARPPPAPTAPLLPFKYLGGLNDAGGPRVFLEVGGRTLLASQGTRLPDGWVLETIAPGRLVFNYEALQQRQTLTTGGRW